MKSMSGKDLPRRFESLVPKLKREYLNDFVYCEVDIIFSYGILYNAILLYMNNSSSFKYFPNYRVLSSAIDLNDIDLETIVGFIQHKN